jgi:hypothetical protein
MEPAYFDMLDELRRSEKDLPTRAEMLRRLIQRATDERVGGTKRGKKSTKAAEANDPDVHRAVREILDAADEPTKAALRAGIIEAAERAPKRR